MRLVIKFEKDMAAEGLTQAGKAGQLKRFFVIGVLLFALLVIIAIVVADISGVLLGWH